MEALSALAIACAAMQIISFGHESYKVAKAVSKDGSPNERLSDAVVHMKELSTTLHGHINSQPTGSPLTPSSQKLLALSKRCLDTATAITALLHYISTNTVGQSRAKRSVAGQTLRWWTHKRKLKALQEDLEGIRCQIETAILGDLW